METKLLKLFKKSPDVYLSGEQASEELGVSRTAVWKHIEKLRGLGYEFDAVPHLGYRLRKSPDKLYSYEIEPFLNTKCIGRNIKYFDTLDSTNTTAYKFAKEGAFEGTAIIAEKQTKGRGRLSREWTSPKNKGIYTSIILRPNMAPYQAPGITLVAAVSVAEALRSSTGIEASIKWPNDILINNKKIAGILTEMEAESDSIKFIILGIGINLNAKFTELPKGSTSAFEELHRKVLRFEIAVALFQKLEENYNIFNKEGFSPIRDKWHDLSATLGRRVRATCINRKIEGEAVGIDTDGALKIRLDNGFHEKVMAGDLVLLR